MRSPSPSVFPPPALSSPLSLRERVGVRVTPVRVTPVRATPPPALFSPLSLSSYPLSLRERVGVRVTSPPPGDSGEGDSGEGDTGEADSPSTNNRKLETLPPACYPQP